MNPIAEPPTEDENKELATLISTLHATNRRLEELTGGEVDAVADPEGGTFLLRRAQDQWRLREADKQAAILDALPVHIALLDGHGLILAVNEAWRQFGAGNALLSPGHAIGLNYLEICDGAHGESSAGAREAAAGIRSVLAGAAGFTLEYPCPTPEAPRWFLLRVAPLAQGGAPGAVVMHVDITERHLAEEARQASEISMALAQGIAHFGSWELDLTHPDDIQANALRWSDEMFRIAGYEPRAVEVTNALFFHLVPVEEHAAIREAIAGAIGNHQRYSIVHRLIRPDGGERILHERGEVSFDPNSGHPLKVIGTAHDITERKLAEKEARFNEQRYRSLVEATTAIVWDTPASGKFELEQPGWEAFTGQSFAEYRGWGWLQAIHPADQAETASAWSAAVSHRTIYAVEHRLRTPDRNYRDMMVRAVPILGDDGEIRQWIGVHTDITERKQAERRIAQQAALINEARDAIIVCDLHHRITFWSQGAERLYGWTATEADGNLLHQLLHADAARFEEAYRIVQSAGAWNGEIEKVAKSGAGLILDSRWTLVRDPRGQPQSILLIDTDITDRKKIEQQFLRAQRMESIGTLAGGIAHDLNNALSPIMMALTVLKMRFPDSESLGLLDILSASAQRGADMVRQVLSFARGVEGRRMEMQVKHLVEEVEKIANDTFLKNIQIRSHLPHDLWTVLGDPTQLHQVLLNLCVNARDVMPHGGTLTLSASNLTLDAHYAGLNLEAKAGPYVLLQVEDTGCGMTPAVMDKIFEPFFTTKEIGQGTGLGLSTSLGIVKGHGGFFRVYSELGKGTKFSVYLPAQIESSLEAVVAPPVELPRGRGEWILGVDDELSVRQIMQRTLETFGYRVLLASEGSEAVTLYATRGSEIAAVITDMMMPVMDGPATILVLLKLNPTVRIIAASGLSPGGPTVGVRHFLPKPYSADTLLKALRQVLDEPA